MSNPINDAIIDGIIDDVAAMSDVDVVSKLNPANLTKVSKFTGDSTHGADIVDYARTVLTDQIYNNFDDWFAIGKS